MAISVDKKKIAVSGHEFIHVYELPDLTNRVVLKVAYNSGNITRLKFMKKFPYILIAASEDGGIRTYDLRTEIPTLAHEAHSPIHSFCLHPNEQNIVIATDNGVLTFCRAGQSTDYYVLEKKVPVLDVAISPDGKYMAAINKRAFCYFFKLQLKKVGNFESLDYQMIRNFKVSPRFALKVKFSPNSEYLITTTSEGFASIWRVPTCQHVKDLTIKGGLGWIWDVQFSKDSMTIYAAASNGRVLEFNMNDTNYKTYHGHKNTVYALALRE